MDRMMVQAFHLQIIAKIFKEQHLWKMLQRNFWKIFIIPINNELSFYTSIKPYKLNKN